MKFCNLNSRLLFITTQKIALILFLSLNISCKEKSSYYDAQTFSYNDFPEIIELNGTYVDLPDIERPRQIHIDGSYLYIVNSQGSMNFLFVYDPITLEKVGEYISFGNGPDEIIYCYQIQFTEDQIWVSDIVQKKVLIYNKEETPDETFKKPAEVLSFKEVSILNLWALEKDRIVINDTQSEYQLLTFINRKEEKEEQNIPFPQYSEMPDSPFFLERIFECRTTIDPKTNNIYIVYLYTDLIDIYNENGILIKRLHGPEQYFPVLQDSQNELGRFAATTKETKFSYFAPIITSNSFWTMFIGQMPSRDTFAFNIFRLDKKGDLEINYKLDIPIFNFCIDETNNKIYALTSFPGDYTVVSFDL